MSNRLFILINSLSKQEKRYFKLFAGNNRKASNYIRLFDVIAKQKSYDEKQVREYFCNETFIKQLHVTKNHLYNLILKSLQLYHTDISAESKIKKLLSFVEILYHKGLYNECTNLLDKAKKIAIENESHLLLIEIIEWHSKIAFIVTKVSNLEKFIFEHYKNEIEILKILRNKSEYRKLFYEILILNNLGTPIRSSFDLTKYKKIISRPLLKNEKMAISYFSRVMFYYIQAYYYLNKGEIDESSRFNERIVSLMEKDPRQIKNSPIHYVAALNNLIYSNIHLKKFSQCYTLLPKLKNIAKNYSLSNDLTIDLKEIIFIRSNFLELELYKESYEFEKAIHLINELKLKIHYFFSIPITRYKIFLMYTISYIYFVLSDYSNALCWINKVLNITEIKEPVDIFCFARILNILIHYELNNFREIEYLYQSNIRFFSKRNRLYKLESFIFNFIKNKLLNKTLSDNLVTDFINLKKELQRITINPQDKKALQYFDCVLWVESKIENMKMNEYLISRKNF